MSLRSVFYKFTYGSEERPTSSFRIAFHSSILKMVPAPSSEISVNYQIIRCHIAKDNLKNRDCRKGEVFSVFK
jgi:hypothetical protein